ncbi:ABC-type transport auxiliary lipoprotein family protein [Salinisphaera sp.]|uniref:PqiC family protein n=1 Tax=Salinisphaera sp. TaxID=1914330 RepID=UPI000C3E6950|nr:ABC-type transport auxiliary lipoprotein family protein [Salinisphaera sp.]MBS64092.1 hypothetical protein [Salinisphaera sp.]
MKTRPLLCLATATLLAGCAGSASSPSLFVLDPGSARQPMSAAATARTQLMVAPVEIAPVLDERGIVYQTGPHRVVIANHNRWAAPLGEQLRESLIATLAEELTDIQVVRRADSATTDRYTLRTRVEQFMGHYDGQARIVGEWQLDDPEGRAVVRQPFLQEVALTNDGYEALVESLAEGWQATGQAMAPAISRATSDRSR